MADVATVQQLLPGWVMDWPSQGADIAAIPALALRSVEVLRDGAAAQYGSDAIAGVINFNLKDSASGVLSKLSTVSTAKVTAPQQFLLLTKALR